MVKAKAIGHKFKKKGIFLPTLNVTGEGQMAIDQLLLEKAIKDLEFSLALRFYYWEGPYLSIGKNLLFYVRVFLML